MMESQLQYNEDSIITSRSSNVQIQRLLKKTVSKFIDIASRCDDDWTDESENDQIIYAKETVLEAC